MNIKYSRCNIINKTMDSFISKYITDKNQKTLASTMILSYMFLILLDCIALSSLSSRVYGIIINVSPSN